METYTPAGAPLRTQAATEEFVDEVEQEELRRGVHLFLCPERKKQTRWPGILFGQYGVDAEICLLAEHAQQPKTRLFARARSAGSAP
jgi:hypothetical protein